MNSLFWNKKIGSYFFCSDGLISCSKCNKALEIGSRIFIHRSFSKKNYNRNLYCLGCIKDHKTQVYDEFINAEIATLPPEGSIIVPEYKPGLQSTKNLTVFEVAEINKLGGEIIDHCKVSHDSNRNIMPGAIEHKERVMKRIKDLTKAATPEFVDGLLKQKLALPEHKTKRLKDETGHQA